ncbi:hypothetical protein MtrunA17_Chr7g0276071 [Medicago truncatula]|uniref:Transmembrane protein n=1 Tax=Medicago truncatula TaxID=3880 RepID=A0A396HAA0_MEDTR|nr:hypothetical protein MtrunA17_Chr7g0276071 [Medicago truncatula]
MMGRIAVILSLPMEFTIAVILILPMQFTFIIVPRLRHVNSFLN